MADEPVILPAYVDEAGARGLVRELKPERDQAISLMCALVFEPGGHAKAIETFRPGFEAFCHAMPLGAKLHITDAFKPGNEAWGKVAAEVRKEYVAHVNTVRPMIVYSARRLRLARDGHARDQMLIAAAQAAKRSNIRIASANRPSDARVEDDLVMCLSLRLDAFAADMASQVHDVAQIDLLFDETDMTEHYEAIIQRTRAISKAVTKVSGLGSRAEQARPRNHRAHRDGTLPPRHEIHRWHSCDWKGSSARAGSGHCHQLFGPSLEAASAQCLLLNAPSSIAEWELEDRVWGVFDNATDDLY